jgi:tripartite-type tricarboxylate transporter receptor subunit TctC
MKRLLILAAAIASAFAANAQTYPGTKPVSIVVPFAAGGPTDRVARDLAIAMAKQIPGSNFVVENAAGAGGTIGANKVAKAAPDGHTLLLFHIGMAATPALYRRLPYNALNDFEYLGMVNDVPMTLIGKPQLPPTPTATLKTTSVPTPAS